jgi:hypothetical protein
VQAIPFARHCSYEDILPLEEAAKPPRLPVEGNASSLYTALIAS